jgi:hypothetical protein
MHHIVNRRLKWGRFAPTSRRKRLRNDKRHRNAAANNLGTTTYKFT